MWDEAGKPVFQALMFFVLFECAEIKYGILFVVWPSAVSQMVIITIEELVNGMVLQKTLQKTKLIHTRLKTGHIQYDSAPYLSAYIQMLGTDTKKNPGSVDMSGYSLDPCVCK